MSNHLDTQQALPITALLIPYLIQPTIVDSSIDSRQCYFIKLMTTVKIIKSFKHKGNKSRVKQDHVKKLASIL